MVHDKRGTKESSGLRQRAEEQIHATQCDLVDGGVLPSYEYLQTLNHELRVHQVELEMQNEELRRATAELEGERKKYFDFYNYAPVGYATLSEQGLILEANLTIAAMLGVPRSKLIRRPIRRFILQDDQRLYQQQLKKLLQTEVPQACDLRIEKDDGTTFWANLATNVAQDAGNTIVFRVIVTDIAERKRHEDALLKSEAHTKTITNATHDAIVMMDSDGLVRFWNPAAEKLFGYTNVEAVGRDLHMLIAPERYHTACHSGLSGFHLTGKGNAIGKTLDLFAKRKDGEEVAVSLSLSGVKIDGPWQAIGILRDVTERKRTELALSEISKRYQFLVDNAGDAIYLADESGRLLDVNPSAERQSGYTRNELLGLKIFDLDVTETPDLRAVAFASKVDGGMSFESKHRRKDGTIFPVDVRADFVIENGIKLRLGYVRDITQRKTAEKMLKRSDRFLRSTLDGLSANIALVDERGTILLVNKAWRDFATLNGINPEVVSEGTNYLKVCDNALSSGTGEKAEPFVEGIRQVLAGTIDTFSMEYPCHAPNKMRWFVGRVTHFLGDGPRRVVIAHEDITSRRALEDVKNNVDRIMRHDLRTPLNGLIGLPQLIKDEVNITADQRVLLQMIEDSGYRMLNMINMSLELFKIESGTHVVTPSKFDIIKAVRKVALDLQPLIKAKEVVLTIDIDGNSRVDSDVFMVWGDEMWSYSMLANLIKNAAEASPKGAIVSILIDRQDDCHIDIRNEGEVPESVRPVFFEKYATLGKPGGTGLGTYSAKLMAKAMGGDVELNTSEPGATTITIRLHCPE